MASSRSRSTSPSASADSLVAEPSHSDEEPRQRAVGVRIELRPLGAEHIFRFEVDPDASVGQIVAKFKTVAFAMFGSHDFGASYKHGTIVFINEASASPQRFDLSDEGMCARFLDTKEIRLFRRAHVDAVCRRDPHINARTVDLISFAHD